MDQRPHWEDKFYSIRQRISALYKNMVHYIVHRRPPIVPIFRQIKSVFIHTAFYLLTDKPISDFAVKNSYWLAIRNNL